MLQREDFKSVGYNAGMSGRPLFVDGIQGNVDEVIIQSTHAQHNMCVFRAWLSSHRHV